MNVILYYAFIVITYYETKGTMLFRLRVNSNSQNHDLHLYK